MREEKVKIMNPSIETIIETSHVAIRHFCACWNTFTRTYIYPSSRSNYNEKILYDFI